MMDRSESSRPRPPRRADAFLERYCAPALLEEIQGDLHELYHRRAARHGPRHARWSYWLDVLLFLRPYVLHREPAYEQARGFVMLKNYLIVALRSLRRRAFYAGINIVGLAVGIACCLLMLLYVQKEYSFDRYHSRADRIYRVVEHREHARAGTSAGPLADALAADYPEVVHTARFAQPIGQTIVRRGETVLNVRDHLWADPEIFEVFDFEWMWGYEGSDPASTLAEPNTVVLTESLARHFFGDTNPVGETLEVLGGNARVTGVLRDVPPNSHTQFSILYPMASMEDDGDWVQYEASWASTGFATYVLLGEGASAEALQAQIADLVNVHPDRAEMDGSRTLALQPLVDIHFESRDIETELNGNEGNATYVYLCAVVALFVLLIACINYMNLATARSLDRAREVGMRKAIGARRGQLVGQFLGESVLTTLVAALLALAVAGGALPLFNELAGTTLTLFSRDAGAAIAILLGIVVTVGLIAGSYPALYLSRFQPILALKAAPSTAVGTSWLRRGLVVAQFALSILLISATFIVRDQLAYVRDRDLGFTRDRLVVVDINSGAVRRDFQAIKEEFGRHAGVRSVAVSSRVPGEWKSILQVDVQSAAAPSETPVQTSFMGIDTDFLSTYEMELASGRNFSEAQGRDSAAVLLNETAARLLGVALPLSGEPEVRVAFQTSDEEIVLQARVVGVVEDFHFRSLHEPIGPIVLGFRTNPFQLIDYFTARVDGEDLEGIVAHFDAVHARFAPGDPIEYNFLDDRWSDFYTADRRVERLFGVSSLLAIVIACLGLFGLAAFTAERRTREIGIRKVLGADVRGIVWMLNREFAVLVGVAFVLAAPVAFFAMRGWLADFAYRIDLGVGPILVAGLAALLVALATVSYQSFRAARVNPAESLRTE